MAHRIGPYSNAGVSSGSGGHGNDVTLVEFALHGKGINGGNANDFNETVKGNASQGNAHGNIVDKKTWHDVKHQFNNNRSSVWREFLLGNQDVSDVESGNEYKMCFVDWVNLRRSD